MRRFIAYLNALLIGAILGLIVVALVHASPLQEQGEHARSVIKTVANAITDNTSRACNH